MTTWRWNIEDRISNTVGSNRVAQSLLTELIENGLLGFTFSLSHSLSSAQFVASIVLDRKTPNLRDRFTSAFWVHALIPTRRLRTL